MQLLQNHQGKAGVSQSRAFSIHKVSLGNVLQFSAGVLKLHPAGLRLTFSSIHFGRVVSTTEFAVPWTDIIQMHFDDPTDLLLVSFRVNVQVFSRWALQPVNDFNLPDGVLSALCSMGAPPFKVTFQSTDLDAHFSSSRYLANASSPSPKAHQRRLHVWHHEHQTRRVNVARRGICIRRY